MDDIDLIRQCQIGNEGAFDNLFKHYANKAMRAAYFITGRKDLAEEVVQESFIQCFNSIGKLRDPEKFKSWFYRIIVRNSWSAVSREHGRITYEELTEDQGTHKDDVMNKIESIEIQEAIQKALQKLSFSHKSVVILYYFNEMSVKEIAKVLNCMQGTVKSRLHTARKILGKELAYLREMSNFRVREECNVNA